MENNPLVVDVVDSGAVRRVVVAGELDLAGVPVVEAALVAADDDRVAELELDLRGVTFIDSSGIRCILDASHRASARGDVLRILPGLEVEVVCGLAGLSGRLPFVQ
jgi:anti-anti-sigma factor